MKADPAELANTVIDFAASTGVTIVTAESCTCGTLTSLLASTPGAGGTVLGGFVCYDKSYKTRVLKVPPELIHSQTMVSELVAEAMAHGALEISGADLAAAITGVAGPDRDEDGNPVGLAHISLVGANGQRCHLKLEVGDRDPESIKTRIVLETLSLMQQMLKLWQVAPNAPERALGQLASL
jgi:PncC family amidohydrolase